MSKEREGAPKEALKYTEVPDHYVWDSKYCNWNERKRRAQGGEVVGRMFQCSPKNPELYALRLLLLRTPGATGYDHLKTVDGEAKATFRAAAKARGLIQTTDEVDKIIEEMLLFECGTSKQCELFAFVFVWHDVGDARELWERHWRFLAAKDLLKAKKRGWPGERPQRRIATGGRYLTELPT